MRKMSEAEIDALLEETREHPHCATTNIDGQPHVVPVWLDVLADGRLRFSSQASTPKARNLLRDGRMALSINENTPTLRMVTVWGIVDEVDRAPEEADLVDHNTRCAARFLDAGRADELGKLYASLPDHWFFTFRVTRKIGWVDLDR